MDTNLAFTEDQPSPIMKSTVQQIRERFDKDVERFSNLEVGQSAQIDSPLALELVAHSAAATAPHAATLLDVGCGAGNFTLKLLQRLPHLEVTLIDLSQPMLDRAVERVRAANSGRVTAAQGDIRDLPLGESRFDIIIAASVLHHLREDIEWKAVFAKFHTALRPGGWLWIHDFIEHSHPAVQALMWERYGAYLTQLKDATYRDHVFAYTQQEDTPRSLMFQLDLLRSVGFQQVEVLHKNNCFAAFGAMKATAAD